MKNPTCKPIAVRKIDQKETCNKSIPTNLLLSFTAATICSALTVKMLKKGELALLTTLLAMPIALIILNRRMESEKHKWTNAPIF